LRKVKRTRETGEKKDGGKGKGRGRGSLQSMRMTGIKRGIAKPFMLAGKLSEAKMKARGEGKYRRQNTKGYRWVKGPNSLT